MDAINSNSPRSHKRMVVQPKASALRSLIRSDRLSFLMEAHNGLSAKVVEEAGFDGIWASGLSISAALGVRDRNEASWTQVVDVLEFMSDATSIPILMDGDTGYGDFNSFRRLVSKLEQRSIAGVCIEDKVFPKTNSFVGHSHQLAEVEEFCGKIKAGKDTQLDDDFCIVARVEALIAGHSVSEALERADAYREAGADAILIHSKGTDASEILEFSSAWANRAPLIVVPTTYYKTPTHVLAEAGISVVIWANHNVRASLRAMRRISRMVRDHGRVDYVEDDIDSVQDLLNITDYQEVIEAESRYLPK